MSKDLSRITGIPVELTDDHRLKLGEGVVCESESIRSRSDLAVVVADETLKLDRSPAYFMYRNVHRSEDESVLLKNDLRFDLTVIPAAKLGNEYIKTSGHYHPPKPGSKVEFPELYYVLSGQATYLMQKNETEGSISDVIISRLKPGEAIIIPPGYGHVTINETETTLVIANWVETNFKSEYGDFETNRGASYYLNTDGKIVKNPRYPNAAEFKIMRSSPQIISELKKTPVYQYVSSIKKIEFLVKPEDFLNDLKIEKLFS